LTWPFRTAASAIHGRLGAIEAARIAATRQESP
jgi:hypothetical protein